MIVIDGSQGEGGGQVLRTSLSLSILTGQPFRIENIRSGRKKPGLMAQHLASVDAAAAVSRAGVQGASPGSQTVTFEPGDIRVGRYSFTIPTAGSACLLLQTIFYPLSQAGSASTISIQGGTHVAWSPCYHYLELNWLPALQRVGYQARMELLQAGFYPEGGGRIQASIRPASPLEPLDLQQRGKLLGIRGLTMVANLPLSIADRQRQQALRRLEELRWDNQRPELAGLPAPRINTLQLPARFKGTCLLLVAEFENSRACFFGLGALGKPAERVADEALDELLDFLDSSAAVDRYLADQLLLPLSLANGPSSLTTQRITSHLLTNAKIIEAFLPARIQIEGQIGQPGRVRIDPAGK
jgi:RNA 3'-terminal phosphate cyclase (ATP)